MTRKYLHVTLASLVSAIALALCNAIQLQQRMSSELRFVTRLAVHFYDLLLFLLLGLCVAITLLLQQIAARRFAGLRRRTAQVVQMGVAGAAFGVLFLASDFANFAANHRTLVGARGLGAFAGILLFLILLGTRVVVSATTERWLAGMVGLVLGYANGGLLVGDYPGIHLAITLFGLVALTSAIGEPGARWPSRARYSAIMLASVALSAVPFLRPPSRSVRQNLTVSSGSSVMPFVASLLAQASRTTATRLPVENTSWFRSRSREPEIPPTPHALLPSNAAVLFLTIDALRTDVVEGRKHDSVLPNLAKIRDASTRFVNARSPTPSTLTTVSSMFSGKYYSQLHFTTQPSGKVLPVSDRSKRVPELLTAAGVHTVQVLALYGLAAKTGIGRGFVAEPKTERDYGRAAAVMDLILLELDQLRSQPQRRLFLYTHFVDSHAPYTLGGKRATPYESYIAELELVDRELGRLLTVLEHDDLKSRCSLVIAADHGEAFGEHGHRFHARSVYDELLRVPLMFRLPGLPPARHDASVTLLDMSATLLDLFGLATPGDFMGESLVPTLVGRGSTLTRPIAADSGRRNQALFFEDGIKVHLDLTRGTAKVFDLRHDPGELRDLTDDPSRDVEPHIGATERFFATHTLKIPGWKPPWRSF